MDKFPGLELKTRDGKTIKKANGVKTGDDLFPEIDNPANIKSLVKDDKKDKQLHKVDKVYIEEMHPPPKIFRDYLKKRIDKMNNPDK